LRALAAAVGMGLERRSGCRRSLLTGLITLAPGDCYPYFINLKLEVMTMVWVSAGDKPDRIVMDEIFCNPDKPKTSQSTLG